ncbi:MAG: hypothetical protein ACK5IC_06325 [Moheibacter sp.]
MNKLITQFLSRIDEEKRIELEEIKTPSIIDGIFGRSKHRRESIYSQLNIVMTFAALFLFFVLLDIFEGLIDGSISIRLIIVTIFLLSIIIFITILKMLTRNQDARTVKLRGREAQSGSL